MHAKSLKSAGSKPTEATLWRWGFIAVALACVVLFAINLIFWDVHPGSPLGMSYGIAATVLLLGAAAYGARRRSMRFASRLGLGRSRAWLYFHVYGGGLFLLLVHMHSGWRLPMGALNWGLWLLSLWTVASGLAGLALQRWIPRVLASGLSVEVNYDRVDELAKGVRERAEQLAESCDDSVRALYQKTVAPALVAPERRLIYFLDPTGGIQTRLAPFRYLENRLPREERLELVELERLFRAKLEIDAHYTLQRALRGWLIVHAPTSFLLVALVAIHISTVLYY